MEKFVNRAYSIFLFIIWLAISIFFMLWLLCYDYWEQWFQHCNDCMYTVYRENLFSPLSPTLLAWKFKSGWIPVSQIIKTVSGQIQHVQDWTKLFASVEGQKLHGLKPCVQYCKPHFCGYLKSQGLSLIPKLEKCW